MWLEAARPDLLILAGLSTTGGAEAESGSGSGIGRCWWFFGSVLVVWCSRAVAVVGGDGGRG